MLGIIGNIYEISFNSYEVDLIIFHFIGRCANSGIKENIYAQDHTVIMK